VPVMVHVSHPYVTVGLIIDLYICSLLAELRSFPDDGRMTETCWIILRNFK